MKNGKHFYDVRPVIAQPASPGTSRTAGMTRTGTLAERERERERERPSVCGYSAGRRRSANSHLEDSRRFARCSSVCPQFGRSIERSALSSAVHGSPRKTNSQIRFRKWHIYLSHSHLNLIHNFSNFIFKEEAIRPSGQLQWTLVGLLENSHPIGRLKLFGLESRCVRYIICLLL